MDSFPSLPLELSPDRALAVELVRRNVGAISRPALEQLAVELMQQSQFYQQCLNLVLMPRDENGADLGR